ncbi:MAG TPA: M56 family metallopeptidase, partial [Candidatus Eisenbacteria bacterium]
MIALSSMTRSLASLGPLAVWPGLLLKVTLLFAAAALVAALCRRRAAATRHFVWLVALAGALALAALTPIAPRLEVVLPRPAGPPRALAATPVPAAGSWLDRERTRAGSWEALNDVGDAAPKHAASRPAASGTSLLAPLRELWRLASGALLSLWLAGFLLVLAWSALGRLALTGLVREAVPVEAAEWRALLAGASEVEISRHGVRVAWSERVGAPLMWGWLRPVILLPREAREWPPGRRRDALLHELAHVTRGDYVAQTLATLACAVFWFHPLVWHAATRLRSECEHACDDVVLGAGTAAAEYATSLLEVARSARALGGAGFVAVGMARRSHLEGRLLAVLDESRARASLSRRAFAAGLAIAALLLVPLAGVAPRLS